MFGNIIELAIASKEIAPSEPPLFAGWTVFCIFQVELRRWLADDVTNLRAGLRELERALGLLSQVSELRTSLRASALETVENERQAPNSK